MDSIRKKILDKRAESKLHILKGFKEVDELQKGTNMNFGPKNSNLVEKKVTDKRGHQTTRWVKNGEDEKPEEKQPKAESEEQNESLANRELSTDELQSHASGTDSSDLKAYLEKNPEGTQSDIARAELEKRGEGMENEMGEQEMSSEPDFNDAEQVKNYISENRDAVVDMMIEDPLLSASSAAKIHYGQNANSGAADEVIDQAIESLQALKSDGGVDGSAKSIIEAYGASYSGDEADAQKWEEMKASLSESGTENPEELHSQLMEAMKGYDAGEGYELEPYERAEEANNIMSELGLGFQVDPDDYDDDDMDDDTADMDSLEDYDGRDTSEDDNDSKDDSKDDSDRDTSEDAIDEEDIDEDMLMDELETAFYEEFGPMDQGMHENDIDTLLEKHDIVGGGIEPINYKKGAKEFIKKVLERNGVVIEPARGPGSNGNR